MSPKELLYIEDALGHETHMESSCNTHACQLQDMELRTFVEQLSAKHRQNFSKLYQLLK